MNEKSREATWRSIAESASNNCNNTYNEMMDGLGKYGTQLHAEGKAAQGDLRLGVAVIIAQRNAARAQVALLEAQLKLTRLALRTVVENSEMASQIVAEIKDIIEEDL